MPFSANRVAGTWAAAGLLALAGPALANDDPRLIEAARKQDRAAVSALLRQRVDVNAAQTDGATALHWAAYWDDMETADRLLRAGARPNRANDFGVTPLSLACTNGSAAMVQRLLAAGADPNISRPSGETPLMTAAHTGNPEVVKALLSRGADLLATERDSGQTALMWAAADRHPDVTELLIEHGANVNATSKNGFTPLMFAAREGDLLSARLLASAGARVDDVARGSCAGCTALLVATVRGHTAVATYLLDQGADPNAGGAGFTALHWASGSWETDMTGVKGYVTEDHEWRHLAGLQGQEKLDLVKALLAHGANPNVRLRRDAPRVGGVSYLGRTFMTFSILGATPFLLASLAGDVDVMRALVDGGAEPGLATDDRTTPAMVAAGMGHVMSESRATEASALEALKLTVELGNDINAANEFGQTALHGAADIRFDSVIQWLAENGAALSIVDVYGRTPLTIAEIDFQKGDLQKGRNDPVRIRTTSGDLLRRLGAVR